jgi:ubiquinone/menaquinone biosynthesis C-methylase UbiE
VTTVQTNRLLTPRDILGGVNGGRLLDVATGGGGFVHFLIEGLDDATEIVGIDISDASRDAFDEALGDRPNVRFELMDARELSFPAASFDTVAVSDSLHHFEDPVVVLREMLRVLKPAGHVIVAEMYRDGQSPAQLTHVELHHWAAAINQTQGIFHRETYPRAELVRLLDSFRLDEVQTFDQADTSHDPKDPDTVAAHEAIITRYLALAVGHKNLERRGRAIRRRLKTVGIHGATELVYIGRKSASE